MNKPLELQDKVKFKVYNQRADTIAESIIVTLYEPISTATDATTRPIRRQISGYIAWMDYE